MLKDEKFDYEKYRIKDDKRMFCFKCGSPAKYICLGYTWCEEHKEFLKQDPEDLEIIVIERLKEEDLWFFLKNECPWQDSNLRPTA